MDEPRALHSWLWASGRSIEGLDIGNQLKEFLFRDVTGKGGHERFVSGGDLQVGKQDRIADIFFICADHLPALKRHRLSVEAFQSRCSDLRAPHVAAATAK